MSKTPVSSPGPVKADVPDFARSAVVIGSPALGHGSLIAEGAVLRAHENSLSIGTGSAVIENCVVIGTGALPTTIGRRAVFGHRCMVVGSDVGDLCEIGNASVLMPGSKLGDHVFLGEGTVVPSGMEIPSSVVAVGRPARIIRSATDEDFERLRVLRGGDLTLTTSTFSNIQQNLEGLNMGQIYAYRGITPTIAASVVLFPTAEITGDVVIGERSIIGAGVKIIGDSHGPVRIGADVQILENTVLHLLPENQLMIGDGATIGPGAMIHGCHIGNGSVVEPGAIVCDGSTVGNNCVIRAGAVVKQRSVFPDRVEIDGFPAAEIRAISAPSRPGWALASGDLPTESIERGNQQ